MGAKQQLHLVNLFEMSIPMFYSSLQRRKNILPLHKPVETGQIWQKLNNNNNNNNNKTNNNNNNNKVILKIAYALHGRDQKLYR